MIQVEKIHDRLWSANGEWYFDGEPITDAEAASLRLHYRDLCAKLKEPWATRDDKYDALSRLNYHWED